MQHITTCFAIPAAVAQRRMRTDKPAWSAITRFEAGVIAIQRCGSTNSGSRCRRGVRKNGYI